MENGVGKIRESVVQVSFGVVPEGVCLLSEVSDLNYLRMAARQCCFCETLGLISSSYANAAHVLGPLSSQTSWRLAMYTGLSLLAIFSNMNNHFFQSDTQRAILKQEVTICICTCVLPINNGILAKYFFLWKLWKLVKTTLHTKLCSYMLLCCVPF